MGAVDAAISEVATAHSAWSSVHGQTAGYQSAKDTANTNLTAANSAYSSANHALNVNVARSASIQSGVSSFGARVTKLGANPTGVKAFLKGVYDRATAFLGTAASNAAAANVGLVAARSAAEQTVADRETDYASASLSLTENLAAVGNAVATVNQKKAAVSTAIATEYPFHTLPGE